MNHDERRALAVKHLDSLIFAVSGAHAEYLPMTSEYIKTLRYPEMVCDNHGAQLHPGVDYIAINCSNGYRYYVNVDGDSTLTACAEALAFASGKL